jgi:alkylation response protein AidB-like acyl-CoA dehydrogenase
VRHCGLRAILTILVSVDGIAQAVLEQCSAYAKRRILFGSPITKNQAISSKLADMATELEAARFPCWGFNKARPDEGAAGHIS